MEKEAAYRFERVIREPLGRGKAFKPLLKESDSVESFCEGHLLNRKVASGEACETGCGYEKECDGPHASGTAGVLSGEVTRGVDN